MTSEEAIMVQDMDNNLACGCGVVALEYSLKTNPLFGIKIVYSVSANR